MLQNLCENKPENDVSSEVKYPMKWFHFLIYFQLFYSVIVNLSTAVPYLLDAVYETQSGGQVSSALIYGIYGNGLYVIDKLYGVILIGTAVLAIVTRFQLAKYKKNAPVYLYTIYSVKIFVPIIYTIAVSTGTGITSFDTQFIIGIIVQGILLLANYKYFSKRRELFNR